MAMRVDGVVKDKMIAGWLALGCFVAVSISLGVVVSARASGKRRWCVELFGALFEAGSFLRNGKRFGWDGWRRCWLLQTFVANWGREADFGWEGRGLLTGCWAGSFVLSSDLTAVACLGDKGVAFGVHPQKCW